MRQNGTNGVTPTRRIVLSGGLSAALWRLGAWARADTPAPAAQSILDFEAATARLQVAPAPAETAATCAYAGAIPGPLIRLRQGEELRLKFANKLTEPTTLSFPGLCAANAAAGIGGLPKKGSSLVLAPTSASYPRIPALIFICPAPARLTPPSKGVGYSARLS
jgi:hypothetical protein